ncbi:MAG: hypothetical protein IJ794_07430 [Lachnospiraceae bacterium]|nr:hypothetical protein [Lachnospiraceae bacterium]MBR1852957.1 hypothetical protein [Lachnospiraceae bacterium]
MKISEKLCGNKFWTALLAAVTVGGLFFYCYAQVPFMMTNDNFYLKSIVSGEMTGTPEFRMYYMGIVFGGVVSTMYRLFPGGVWYGLAMVASVGAALAYLLHCILRECRTVVMQLGASAIFFFLTFGFFTRHIVKSEFTTVTGIVGCASLLALYLLDESRDHRSYGKSMLPMLLFSIWSAGMRDKAYYMLLPFAGMIFLGKFYDVCISGKKENRKNFFLLCVGIGGALLILWFGTAVAYGGDDWQTFRAYTDASEEVFDYYGFPDYDSHRELYEELGITRSSFEAVTGHYNILLDPAINEHSMKTLAATGKRETMADKGGAGARIIRVAEQFFERNITSYTERPTNILVYLLYLMVWLFALAGRRKKAVRDVLFVMTGSLFLWVYLIDGGRFPTRVTQIIFTAELFLLVGIVLRHRLWEVLMIRRAGKVFPAGAVMCVLLLCAACIRFGVPVARAHIAETRSFYEFSSSYRELQDYLAANRDKFYYFDMSHLYFEEEVFEKPEMIRDAAGKTVHAQHNYLYMGSWMPNSPWYDKVFAQLGITDIGEALMTKDNVYLLYQEVDFDSWDFLKRYYEEHYPGCELRVVDEFTTTNGTKYDIIKGF